MKTKFERFYDLEGQKYEKTNIENQLSEIFNVCYKCTEEGVKNNPNDDDDMEYHSVFNAINKVSSITINYDKSTGFIIAPLLIF